MFEFKIIAQLVSRRNKPSPNPRQDVDDFRAQKRAEGYTEPEISNILIASRIQSEAALIWRGVSDKDIDTMNWGYLLTSPLPPRPTRDYVIYPNDWQETQYSLRRRGYSEGIINDVLQGIGEFQQRQAQPPSFWQVQPRQEPPGSRAESFARLIKQGYTEDEIRRIFDARLRTARGFNRYPDIEEAPFVVLAGHSKKAAARPSLRLIVTAPTSKPR